MAVKRGLGRGLEALFGGAEQEYENATSSYKGGLVEDGDKSQAVEISVEKIIPNVNQPRKNFDEVAMSELINSVRVHGVISPIVLVKSGDDFMIIAGERRWRASKAAGLKTVPAIVRDYDNKQIKEISLVENLQREDLNPIEVANSIKQLMDDYKYTQEQVAERVGKSRSAVANTLRLLTLSKPVIDLIAVGKLSEGHARTLVVVKDDNAQLKFAHDSLNDRIAVRDLEKKVKAYLNPKTAGAPVVVQSAELKDLVGRMQKVFATKVGALGNDNKGRIFIDYYNRDDLDRLAEMIETLEALKKEKEKDV